MINICIFEDDVYQELHPLTVLRPAYDLLLGISTILEKIRFYFDYANLTIHCRDYLTPLVKHKHRDLSVNRINTGSPCLFLNGRVIMDQPLFDTLTNHTNSHDLLFTYKGQVIALYLRSAQMEAMKNLLTDIPSNEDIIRTFRSNCVTKELDQVKIVSKLWDLLTLNESVLRDDFVKFNQPGIIKGDLQPLTSIYNENNVFIDKNTVIEDFVVLNATKGPIFIENGVHIEAHSRLEGPLFIGKHTRINGARISASSIGPHCKVGGEFKNSIMLGYTNKGHDGFIGHSYIGEWVNMGAMTTNSNLKNNYQPVRIEIGEKKTSTQQQFFGSIVGDHVKMGIGTLLNTGSIIGFGASIFGSTIHPKYVPSFAWGNAKQYKKHDSDKFFQTAHEMMKRRHYELSSAEQDVIKLLYDKGQFKSS
ncbi:hypothetical protein HOH87_05615 [bacterium]|jgi:UDP-N-acetylglucosamine diphosphorylase / glucose-1-phosphate thymidylyltransferase / UDP-N-acetylgalactosamine diphosphorylase / glucosamine-1-phosphate N-acetyltransferase / galactosamine-1-phosphate N-acetyltransferase|nr:hypothetical protein [bacterium]